MQSRSLTLFELFNLPEKHSLLALQVYGGVQSSTKFFFFFFFFFNTLTVLARMQTAAGTQNQQ